MYKLLKQAFTLIELLVVIAIIGILSGLIIVGMNGMTQSANIAKSQVFSNSLRNSLLMNLVSEWNLDETAGTSSIDSWKGVSPGTLYNFNFNSTDGWRSGNQCVYGGCLQFDGTNDYIDFGNVYGPSTTTNRTYSFWVYPKTLTGGTIFSTGNLYYFKGGYSIFRLYSNGVIVSYDLNDDPYVYYFNTVADINKWNYFVLSVDISSSINVVLKLYKNSAYMSTATLARSTDYQEERTFLMGAEYYDVTNDKVNFLNGFIDQFRIYNAAMPTSQIREQYYSGLNKLFINDAISTNDYVEGIKSSELSVR